MNASLSSRFRVSPASIKRFLVRSRHERQVLPRTRAINLMLMSTVIPAVQAVMDDLVERDVERGLQVAAYLDGQLVLDTWSGLADASTQRAVNGGTLFACFSCGKGVVATAIHLLAERGRIDFDTPVAHYWPAFGANGKAEITVR